MMPIQITLHPHSTDYRPGERIRGSLTVSLPPHQQVSASALTLVWTGSVTTSVGDKTDHYNYFKETWRMNTDIVRQAYSPTPRDPDNHHIVYSPGFVLQDVFSSPKESPVILDGGTAHEFMFELFVPQKHSMPGSLKYTKGTGGIEIAYHIEAFFKEDALPHRAQVQVPLSGHVDVGRLGENLGPGLVEAVYSAWLSVADMRQGFEPNFKAAARILLEPREHAPDSVVPFAFYFWHGQRFQLEEGICVRLIRTIKTICQESTIVFEETEITQKAFPLNVIDVAGYYQQVIEDELTIPEDCISTTTFTQSVLVSVDYHVKVLVNACPGAVYIREGDAQCGSRVELDIPIVVGKWPASPISPTTACNGRDYSVPAVADKAVRSTSMNGNIKSRIPALFRRQTKPESTSLPSSPRNSILNILSVFKIRQKSMQSLCQSQADFPPHLDFSPGGTGSFTFTLPAFNQSPHHSPRSSLKSSTSQQKTSSTHHEKFVANSPSELRMAPPSPSPPPASERHICSPNRSVADVTSPLGDVFPDPFLNWSGNEGLESFLTRTADSFADSENNEARSGDTISSPSNHHHPNPFPACNDKPDQVTDTESDDSEWSDDDPISVARRREKRLERRRITPRGSRDHRAL